MFCPKSSTVCLISQSLEVDGVEIAVVSGNFPSSQTFIEVKIAETAMAIKDGATEVDIVMPVGKFFSEDYEGLCDDIQELKETCGEHKMKCILETGDLKNCSNIMKASILAMYSQKLLASYGYPCLCNDHSRMLYAEEYGEEQMVACLQRPKYK